MRKSSSRFDITKDIYSSKPENKILLILFLVTFFQLQAKPKTVGLLIPKINIINALENGQEELISGMVLDETGQPLPGASVVIKGTNVGVTTDFDGNFTINASVESVLVVSYIGYLTKEVIVIDNKEIFVTLEAETTTIDEVVVIGYGTSSVKKVTSAIAKVDDSHISKVASANVDQALVGTMAGVTITQSNPTPGQDSNITIRGVGTLTAGAQPLIVVDGFPLTEGSGLSSINPDDIASIDVLKDAAAAAIYGSRGANGVLIVTTKKGKKGKMKISFNSFAGIQQRGDDNLKLVNAYDAAQYFKEARDWAYVLGDMENRNSDDDNALRRARGAGSRQLNLSYTEPYLNGESGLTDTDWYNDVIFRDAIINKTSLALSGASEKTNYYVSGGYMRQEGIVIGSDFERFSLNTKFNTQISDKLDFGINMNTSHSFTKYVENDGGWGSRGANGSGSYPDPVATGILMFPFFSPRNEDGNLIVSEQLTKNLEGDGALAENILAMVETNKNERVSFRSFGNMYLNVEILEGFTFKTSNGIDYRSYVFDFFTPSNVGKYRTHALDKLASATETYIIAENFLTENTLHYTKRLGSHQVEALLGQTYQQEERQRTDTDAIGFVDDRIRNVSGGSVFDVRFNRTKWALISYLGRLSYDYNSKYLFSFAIRRDGSSRFGDDTKWGWFPSLSAGWLISNESFFPKGNKILDFAKLRASWGKNGNNQIGNYSSQALIGSYDYVYGENVAPGFSTSSAPNPDLSWETNTSYNVGLDLGFFDQKLSISTNYYNSNTTDLLLNVPVPQQSGFNESLQNIGEVLNRGFEFEMSVSSIHLGAFTVGLHANFSTNYNEVLALGNGQDQIVDGTNSVFVTKVGGPIAEMYGYQVVGVFKSEEEINRHAHLEGTNVGDYWLADANGDGLINDDDKLAFGTYAPNINYAFGGNLTYDNFDFSFSFVGVEGRKIYDRMLHTFLEFGEGFSLPSQEYFDHRYHPENNPDGIYARPNTNFALSASRPESRASNLFFKNADYLRLQAVQIGYTFNKKQLEQFGFDHMRVYLMGNNLLTLTNFKGFNPDATRSSGNPLRAGDANSNNPVPRSFALGVKFNL